MLKDFITTQKAFKKSVEENLDKLDSLSLKVENCRGVGNRVGSPQRKQPFKTRLVPIGLLLGRAGQTYDRLPPSNRPYRMPAVGPGAIGPTFRHQRRSSDWTAAGPRWPLTWPIALEQSALPDNSRPRRNRHTPSRRVDPNPVGAPGTVS